MRNPFVLMALAAAMMRASVADFVAPAGAVRGRARIAGKRRPAGAKLARLAAKGRCAMGQPR